MYFSNPQKDLWEEENALLHEGWHNGEQINHVFSHRIPGILLMSINVVSDDQCGSLIIILYYMHRKIKSAVKLKLSYIMYISISNRYHNYWHLNHIEPCWSFRPRRGISISHLFPSASNNHSYDFILDKRWEFIKERFIEKKKENTLSTKKKE